MMILKGFSSARRGSRKVHTNTKVVAWTPQESSSRGLQKSTASGNEQFRARPASLAGHLTRLRPESVGSILTPWTATSKQVAAVDSILWRLRHNLDAWLWIWAREASLVRGWLAWRQRGYSIDCMTDREHRGAEDRNRRLGSRSKYK